MSLYVYTYCHIHGTLVALGVTQDSFHRTQHLGGGGGVGDSASERGWDACWKFWIKPLKETNLGVAQAFFNP